MALGDDAARLYDDVALATVLLADPERGARLHASTLGPLAEDTPSAHGLRETLRQYYAANGNKAATAWALGIHEKTVAYRLRRATALLDLDVDADRPRIEAALVIGRADRSRRRSATA
jgi:DNA-binding PucR family transcriptional regulator